MSRHCLRQKKDIDSGVHEYIFIKWKLGKDTYAAYFYKFPSQTIIGRSDCIFYIIDYNNGEACLYYDRAGGGLWISGAGGAGA